MFLYLQSAHAPKDSFAHGAEVRILTTITQAPKHMLGRETATHLSWESVKAIALAGCHNSPARVAELIESLKNLKF